MAIDWKGVFPAVTTKFTSNDTLDLALFTKNIEAQIAAGVNGIILGGTLGESSVLTNAEKEILVKETVKIVNGKIPVVINTTKRLKPGDFVMVKITKAYDYDLEGELID